MNGLIKKALATLTKDERLKKFGTTKMIDSTTVSMCLTFFDWAEFRSTKAGIKMHTGIDGSTGIPDRVIFSNAKCHDRTKMDDLMTDKGTIYICDKGYIDYDKFDAYSSKGIYFVSRLKDNAHINEIEELTFITNLMKFSSEEIAWLYKRRFYSIKQCQWKFYL